MGVYGLTSFIAQNPELYLKPYELHDCNLVIDGDNLIHNLYRTSPQCTLSFGGDYDIFYRVVRNFFEILFKCNIKPFVLFDGAYVDKKMNTTEERLRQRINSIANIKSKKSGVFPPMIREVFIDAAKDSGGVMIMKCIFEADDEVAILARKLNCPVLSSDSDFYIHNVKYIPIVTLTLKVLEKKEGTKQCKNGLSNDLKKRIIQNKSLRGTNWLDNSGISNKQGTIRYLDCCMYTIENFCSKEKIHKDTLPIFAAILGNDYIKSYNIFNEFYSRIKVEGFNTKMTINHRHIKAILKWLRHETKESAVEKILSKINKGEKDQLLKQIENATDGYNIKKSAAFEYFCLKEDDYKVDDLDDENYENGDINYDEDESEDEIFIESVKEQNEIEEESESVDDFEASSNVESDHEEFEEIELPHWLKQGIMSCELPAFLVSLLRRHTYVNGTLIQNLHFEDCNSISIPILMHIYALITHPKSFDLKYLTRIDGERNIHYINLSPAPSYPFNPFVTDLNAFKMVFPANVFPTQKLFKEIQKLPPNLHLYFLAIVYWAKKSAHADVLHFYSLIICLVILSTVDESCAEVRDPGLFHERFGQFIQSFIKVQEKPVTLENSYMFQKHVSNTQLAIRESEEKVKYLPILEKIKHIPKISSVLIIKRLWRYLNTSNDSWQDCHNFSVNILHTYSEFQSVLSFLNSLNQLVKKPFEKTKMSHYYNGVFLYNLFVNLKAKNDIEYYIENFIFKDSRIMFEYYKFLIDWCKEFVPFFETTTATAMNKKSKRKTKKKKKDNASGNSVLLDAAADMIDQDDDDDRFKDLNNQFCTLLKFK